MSIDPHAETPLSQEAAEPVNPPSWHGPIAELQAADAKHDARLSALESGFARLEQKTDAQTVILSRIDGAVSTAAKNPWVRALFVALALAFTAWLSRHGIHVEVPAQ